MLAISCQFSQIDSVAHAVKFRKTSCWQKPSKGQKPLCEDSEQNWPARWSSCCVLDSPATSPVDKLTRFVFVFLFLNCICEDSEHNWPAGLVVVFLRSTATSPVDKLTRFAFAFVIIFVLTIVFVFVKILSRTG